MRAGLLSDPKVINELNTRFISTTILIDDQPAPETIEVKSAQLAVASHVAEDGPNLWGWVIFPGGFRAPALMALAKRQAWTLKPALLQKEAR